MPQIGHYYNKTERKEQREYIPQDDFMIIQLPSHVKLRMCIASKYLVSILGNMNVLFALKHAASVMRISTTLVYVSLVTIKNLRIFGPKSFGYRWKFWNKFELDKNNNGSKFCLPFVPLESIILNITKNVGVKYHGPLSAVSAKI